MSTSTPASRASLATEAVSAPTPCLSSSPMPVQSLTTNPSNPHSPRSPPVVRRRLACAGIPATSLKLAITVAAPAHTAAWNGGR